MKRLLSFVLIITLLTSTLAGCGTTNSAETPTDPIPTETIPETEAPPEGPPRTPADFLAQFNARIQKNGIPLDFSFLEPEDRGDHYWTPCTATHVGDGAPVSSDGITLWVKFTENFSGPLLAVELYLAPGCSNQTKELHRRLCMAASLLCDENIDANIAQSLYTYGTTQPYPFPSGTFYENGIFVDSRQIGTDGDLSSIYDLLYCFCQPKDITHTIILTKKLIDSPSIMDRQYQILFTDAPEPEAALTIGELEEGINSYFAQQGIPLECGFQVSGTQYDTFIQPKIQSFNENDGYLINYDDKGYADWKAVFRFTTLDDPNTAYPVPDISKRYGDSQDPEYYAYWINRDIPLSLQVNAKGFTSDAIICKWSFRNSFRWLCQDSEYYTVPWDESWDSICWQFLNEICRLWCQETGDSTVNGFLTTELSEAVPETANLDTDLYQISWNTLDTSDLIEVTYKPYAKKTFKQPENLLDPQLLDYKYTFNKPILEDGFFFAEDAYAGKYLYRTDIYAGSDGLSFIPMNILHQYLVSTGSKVTMYKRGIASTTYGVNKFDIQLAEPEKMESMFYGILEWDILHAPSEREFVTSPDAYIFYYWSDEETYNTLGYSNVDTDYLLRVPIGLSQILDEGMTVEEAINLHTQPQEEVLHTDTYSASFYAPRDVVHVTISIDSLTTMYCVLPKAIYQSEFKDLESLAEAMVKYWYLSFTYGYLYDGESLQNRGMEQSDLSLD